MVPSVFGRRTLAAIVTGSVRRRLSTVFALSSGQGRCGVAVIRVSGPASADALRALTGRSRLPVARRAVVRPLYSPSDGGLLDRALLLWLPGPASFTGEDSCELHTHGGPAVVAAVLRALAEVPGLQPARPGEFTRRAFHAGKLDVTQVEGLADLLAAETEQQRRQAVRQAEGALRRQCGEWRAALLRCLGAAEAYIDFGEEELLDEETLPETAAAAARLADDMQRHLADGRRGERLRSGVQVTIAGAPNAGKSSLLNVLVQREAAIVSEVPGTTRDLLDTTLDVAGYPVVLTDTAGLREASDAVEQEGVRRARRSADAADLILLVVDSRLALDWLDRPAPPVSPGPHDPPGSPDPLRMEGRGVTESRTERRTVAEPGTDGRTVAEFAAEQLATLGLSTGAGADVGAAGAGGDSAGDDTPPPEPLLVLNKCDLLSAEAAARLSEWCAPRTPLVSCLTGAGLSEMVDTLGARLGGLCADAAAPAPALTRQRHRLHVAACERHVRQFVRQLRDGGDLALASEQLRQAARRLGEITGHVAAEEILDVIFRDFCIGK